MTHSLPPSFPPFLLPANPYLDPGPELLLIMLQGVAEGAGGAGGGGHREKDEGQEDAHDALIDERGKGAVLGSKEGTGVSDCGRDRVKERRQ
jgi:hypothetical protein